MRVVSIDTVRCPSCHAEQNHVIWSDPSKIPYYIKCPKCEVFFKTKGCVTKGKEGFIKSYDTRRTSFLTIEGYKAAIEKGLFNGDENDIENLRRELSRLLEERTDL